MAKFYCTQRFYQERTYYEEVVYSTEPTKGTEEQPISEQEIQAFAESGQLKRLQPIDKEAKAMIAEATAAADKKAKAIDVKSVASKLVAWRDEFGNLYVMSALVTILFLGGWQIPGLAPSAVSGWKLELAGGAGRKASKLPT